MTAVLVLLLMAWLMVPKSERMQPFIPTPTMLKFVYAMNVFSVTTITVFVCLALRRYGIL